MDLKKVLADIDNVKAKGNLDVNIESIESDSRKVREGCMFVAIKGFETDGHNYVNKAIEMGAKVVMVQADSN